ncbi:MAG: hypothetical protein V9E85_03825 [Candidatus Nanopelagicales bacterium]
MSEQPPERAPILGIAPDGRPYAGWGLRALAFFLDFLAGLDPHGHRTNLLRFVDHQLLTVTGRAGLRTKCMETRGPSFMFYLLYAVAIIYWFWNKGYRRRNHRAIHREDGSLASPPLTNLTNEPLGRRARTATRTACLSLS